MNEKLPNAVHHILANTGTNLHKIDNSTAQLEVFQEKITVHDSL
ncbi:6745_t:CDS:1, partial [Paraglomus occultum]